MTRPARILFAMESNTVNIHGIEFFGAKGDAVLASMDGSIVIFSDDSGRYVSFQIMDRSVNEFEEFLSNFEICSIGI